MKKVSEVINELESLKAKYGDLPIVKRGFTTPFITDWPDVGFSKHGAIEQEYGTRADVIVIW